MINHSLIDRLFDKTVVDKDDDKIGTVGQVFVSRRDGHPTWATVKTGLFGNKESFVPLDSATYSDDVLHIAFDKAFVKHAPRIDTDGALSPEEEDELYRYYSVQDDDSDDSSDRNDDRDHDKGGLFHRGHDGDRDRDGDHEKRGLFGIGGGHGDDRRDDDGQGRGKHGLFGHGDDDRHDSDSGGRGRHVATAASAAAAAAGGTAAAGEVRSEDGLGHRGLGEPAPIDGSSHSTGRNDDMTAGDGRDALGSDAQRSAMEHQGLGNDQPGFGDAEKRSAFSDDTDSATRDAGLGSNAGASSDGVTGRDTATRDAGLGSGPDGVGGGQRDTATRDAGLGDEDQGRGLNDPATRNRSDDTATDLAGSDVSHRDPLAYDPVHDVDSGTGRHASNLEFDNQVNERNNREGEITNTEDGGRDTDTLGRPMNDPESVGFGTGGDASRTGGEQSRESRMRRWSGNEGDQR
ncbi:PRC-barrel domain-containing protein [Herbiconiux sp. SYSU D00978]|uniref:PRC-barrel domain-containing protein n=1 Tax=Herbiconiux sp. SYSU D00978 TaxID=2812562 RepID=UPI001A97611D|nr:PRC-barrel domain-containing protein [Herbiconiux sp. SYSU D00978]